MNATPRTLTIISITTTPRTLPIFDIPPHLCNLQITHRMISYGRVRANNISSACVPNNITGIHFLGAHFASVHVPNNTAGTHFSAYLGIFSHLNIIPIAY